MNGKLTAEQVRELIAPHLKARPTFDFGRHGAVWSADFQAIADELNAIGGGECVMNLVKMFPEHKDCIFECWECSACKRTNEEYRPRFCPYCGRKVKR